MCIREDCFERTRGFNYSNNKNPHLLHQNNPGSEKLRVKYDEYEKKFEEYEKQKNEYDNKYKGCIIGVSSNRKKYNFENKNIVSNIKDFSYPPLPPKDPRNDVDDDLQDRLDKLTNDGPPTSTKKEKKIQPKKSSYVSSYIMKWKRNNKGLCDKIPDDVWIEILLYINLGEIIEHYFTLSKHFNHLFFRNNSYLFKRLNKLNKTNYITYFRDKKYHLYSVNNHQSIFCNSFKIDVTVNYEFFKHINYTEKYLFEDIKNIFYKMKSDKEYFWKCYKNEFSISDFLKSEKEKEKYVDLKLKELKKYLKKFGLNGASRLHGSILKKRNSMWKLKCANIKNMEKIKKYEDEIKKLEKKHKKLKKERVKIHKKIYKIKRLLYSKIYKLELNSEHNRKNGYKTTTSSTSSYDQKKGKNIFSKIFQKKKKNKLKKNTNHLFGYRIFKKNEYNSNDYILFTIDLNEKVILIRKKNKIYVDKPKDQLIYNDEHEYDDQRFRG